VIGYQWKFVFGQINKAKKWPVPGLAIITSFQRVIQRTNLRILIQRGGVWCLHVGKVVLFTHTKPSRIADALILIMHRHNIHNIGLTEAMT
jgi:CRP-like cAMP-binding protein